VRERGEHAVEIRSREIRGAPFTGQPVLQTTPYETSIGEERFLEFVTPDDRLLGFCRLALPATDSFMAELASAALLREVHVYGASLALGDRREGRAQHQGLGARLIEEAVRQAREHGFAKLSVISAVGTRGYYRRRGFTDGVLYQHRVL
jgi:elongator complex protein 3